jgi:DNA-damage-inducible protein D
LEDDRRLLLRDELKQHNTKLADVAKGTGVIEPIDYAIFQNHGYRGLYNGLDQAGIHRKKRLKKSQKILDHMSSSELAANLFRATERQPHCHLGLGDGKTSSGSVNESSQTVTGKHTYTSAGVYTLKKTKKKSACSFAAHPQNSDSFC